MAARIRSLRNGLTPIDDASRNDLVVGDIVTVTAIDPATTYNWSIIFAPDGSTATFSGSSTAVSPGSFTVDLEGPYLIRLITNIGGPTESSQYVRLRALTTPLGLRLVSAGEKRDGTGIVPVDVSPEGWANDQNYNLQALESAISSSMSSQILSAPFSFSSSSPITVGPLSATAFVLQTRIFIATPFDDPASAISVGVTGTPSALMSSGENDPLTAGTYLSDETYPSSGFTNVTLTISPAASTAGSGVVFVLVHNP